LHCYALDAVEISPFLAVTSPEKRCGKTISLEVTGALVPCPLPASNVSPAALYRVIEQFRPVLLIDECDTWMDVSEELRGIINASHRKSFAFVLRCQGEESDPKPFTTWCPKALARIGEFKDTIADRAIIIRLVRKLSDEKVERFHLDQAIHEFEPIRRKAVRWSQDHLEELRKGEPETPLKLNDRAADNWRPLLAIADIVGGHWPATARRSALLLSGEDQDEDSQSIRVMLLGDIRDIFEREKATNLPSADLVKHLASIEEHPWGEWGKSSKPISTYQLARLLKPFGIRPKLLWAGQTFRGYDLEQFQEAFSRYIPGSRVLDPLGSATDAGLSSFSEVLGNPVPNTSETDVTPRKQRLLTGLTLQNPGKGPSGEGIPPKEPEKVPVEDEPAWKVEIRDFFKRKREEYDWRNPEEGNL
jgi:hypothetical protein